MRLRFALIVNRLARVAFALTAILIPFRHRVVLQARPLSTIYHDYTDLLLFASDISLIATLVCWLIGLVLASRSMRPGPPFLTMPIAAFTLFGILSICVSVDAVLSAYQAVRLLLLFGLYLYVRNEIQTPDAIVFPVGAQVFVQASVAIAQHLAQHSVGLASLGELPLDPAQGGVSIVLADGVRSLRAYGLSDHPNILGGCLALALLLIAGGYSTSSSRWRILIASAFALGLTALLLSFSRSAWAALGAGLLLSAALLWRTRNRQALQEWSALLAASLLLLLPWLWQNAAHLGVRFNQQNSFASLDDVGRPIEGRALSERNTVNEATLAIYADHPLVGVGLGALPIAMYYAFPDFPYYYQPAHVVLLDVAAEIGGVGALFYGLTMIAPWLALWRQRGRLSLSPALIAASSALLAVTMIGFFDYYPWLLMPGRLWQWLIWGWWAASYQSSHGGAVDA